MTMNGKQALVTVVEIILILIGGLFILNENVLSNVILDVLIRLVALIYCIAIFLISYKIKNKMEDI